MFTGKKSLYIAVIIVFTLSSAVLAEWDVENANPVKGSWKSKQGITYDFDADGGMRKTANESGSSNSNRYKYTLVTSGTHNLIKYSDPRYGSAKMNLLMVTSLTDSTATISHGLAFARADSGSGLTGDWLHVDELSMIRWHIDQDTVTYQHEELDMKTGAYTVLEDRSGTFTMGHHMDDTGRLYIDFSDGSNAVVFPLLFHDVMFLFDFSAIRSSFSKTSHEQTKTVSVK